jgi:hypothetical protein
MANLADKIAALLPRADGNPAAMIQLARLMRKDGQRERALSLCQKALALAPTDAKLVREAKWFLSDDVPAWQFSIVRDNICAMPPTTPHYAVRSVPIRASSKSAQVSWR